MNKLKCNVCNKEVTDDDSVVCCSAFGPCSFRYCNECYSKGLEPYDHMVSYVAFAGYFPEDINEHFQNLVRLILNKLGKSEKEFIEDVKLAHDKYDSIFDIPGLSDEDVTYKNIEDEFEDF